MITLPIYFHTEDTEKFDKVDIDYSITDCEIRPVHFFSIVAVSEFREEGKTVAVRIHTNGDSFLCSLSVDEVVKAVKEWKTPETKNKP